MSVSVINSPLFHSLPKEVVNTILLFTGKFIIDKRDKTKLRSIILIYDYENINRCLKIKKKKLWHIVNELCPWVFEFSSEEERNKQELEHSACVNYYRHPLLFLKPCEIEEFMIPLQDNMVCSFCEKNCTSSELSFYSMIKLKQSLFSRYIREYNCARCNAIIKQQTNTTEQEYKLKKDNVYKYKHHLKIVCKNIQYILKNKIGNKYTRQKK